MGAHTVPFKSTQLKGVKAEIASVDQCGAPGQNPTVLFTITENDGTPIPPGSFTVHNSDGSTSSLNVVMSGPTTDYSLPPSSASAPTARRRAATNDSYTFTHAIPADPRAPGRSRSKRAAP